MSDITLNDFLKEGKSELSGVGRTLAALLGKNVSLLDFD